MIPTPLRLAASLLTLALLAACGGEDPAVSAPTEPPDPLAARGIAVTTGAAAGYVEDQACKLCHSSLFRDYQEVGMAQSFFRPTDERMMEDFAAAPFYHPPSQSYYALHRDGEDLLFRRYQQDAAGAPINLFERKVDWVVGSGHTSRLYLYQTPNGELYQFPLAWYTQGAGWAMAPGYDNPNHEGVLRRVRRECMFCHNAYPEVPTGSDAYGMPHTYPQGLPQGTGCQRCHGPGAAHLRAAYGTPDDDAAIRAAIVNPGRLAPERRDDVCNQCHLQASVVLFGVRRFERDDYSFRPGEPLSDFLLKVDVEEADQTRDERFEINHHPYRLYQSRCFLESRAADPTEGMSCLTCHDPHRKVPERRRKTHYRDACLSCHTVEACTLESMGAAGNPQGIDPQDCVACHMPPRRTQDVVHVLMTDHKIQRRPPSEAERLAPREERVPVVTEVNFLTSDAPTQTLGEIYRTSTVLRARAASPAVNVLYPLILETDFEALPPYIDAIRALLQQRRFAEAETMMTEALARHPDHPLLLDWQGILLSALGRPTEAIDALQRAVTLDGHRPEAEYNLGGLLLNQGETEAAIGWLQSALAARPNIAAAHFFLGSAYVRQGKIDEALAAYRRTLEVDPKHTRAYLALGQTLLARAKDGDREEALRWWRHGARVAQPAAPVREALAQVEPRP